MTKASLLITSSNVALLYASSIKLGSDLCTAVTWMNAADNTTAANTKCSSNIRHSEYDAGVSAPRIAGNTTGPNAGITVTRLNITTIAQ